MLDVRMIPGVKDLPVPTAKQMRKLNAEASAARTGRKLGAAKSKDEMMAESPYENYINFRKCTQVVDCGTQDPIQYLDDLYKRGDAKAIYEKLKERHRGMFTNNVRFQRIGNDLKKISVLIELLRKAESLLLPEYNAGVSELRQEIKALGT